MAGRDNHEGRAAGTSNYRSPGKLSSSDRVVEDKRHLPRQHWRGLGYPQRHIEVSALRHHLQARGERLKRARSEIGERALIIMAKAARVGRVKPRLAASLPAEAVVDLYRCMIEDTLDLARSVSTDALAIVCPTSDVADLASWLPAIEIVGQQGEGLAAGLVSAFRIFIDRGYRRVVAIDSDSPQLPPETLDKAFQLLDVADSVVGPTADGGYYLVGSTTVQAELFDTQRMGT